MLHDVTPCVPIPSRPQAARRSRSSLGHRAVGKPSVLPDTASDSGAGHAGLTAALYAARASLDPLVVQGAAPGGQRITTTAVDHDPGFTEGILGPALIECSVREAMAIGALPALDPVTTAQTVVTSFEGVML